MPLPVWVLTHDQRQGFRALVSGCSDWITEVGGKGLDEVPSIFLRLGGSDGAKQVLELTAWAYIAKTVYFTGDLVCEPLFGEWDYRTVLHGPVWIFGTPLFYEYQVVFAATRPAAIGFTSSSCGTCVLGVPSPSEDDEMSLALDRGITHKRRIPRLMRGKPRMPSIDPSQPL